MNTGTAPIRFSSTAIGLHWLIALLIAGAFGLGWYMNDLPISPARLQYYAWHKWVGVTVFGLAFLRLFWRLTHRPPSPPATMARWQVYASALAHAALYLLLFAVPLSGWLYSSASGYPVVYLKLVQLPDLVGKDKALAHTLKEVHELLTTVLLWLVILHVAAALKHQFWDRDGLLWRMWPRRLGGS